MAKKKYPYVMFQLTSSLNIKEITMVGPAMQKGYAGGKDYEKSSYAADAKGHHHYLPNLFESRAQAVDNAKGTIAEQERRHQKAGENLAKRQANVKKLES